MAILKWGEKYLTGVEKFDAEHQQLIERLNTLYEEIFECTTLDAERRLTEDVLSDLLDYVNVHFQGEEELMEKLNYPEYEEHKKAHLFFNAEVRRLLAQHESGELALSFPVFVFLKEWIETHIMVVDKRYGEFFKR